MTHMTTQATPSPASIPTFSIGDRCKKAREHAGLDQDQLARITGLSRQTISNYERDKTSQKLASLNLIALATGVDRNWIATGVPSDTMPPDGPTTLRDLGEPPTIWYVPVPCAA